MFHRSMRKRRKGEAKRREMVDLEKMHEKDLYPAVENILEDPKELSFRIHWK